MSEITAPPNPLLDKLRMPGATYRLPSQGVFYKNGELDPSVQNGEVEVYPLTTIDEIVLSTPDKLMSGKAIIEVFGRCIPQILKPGALLSRDVDFLMVALRAVSFGDTLEVSYAHNCKPNDEQYKPLNRTYKVNLQQIIRSTKNINPTTIGTEYVTTLPNGQRIQMKPLTYMEVISLYQMTAMTKNRDISEEEAEMLIVSTLAGAIHSVDGITDPTMIREWVSALQIGWKRLIEQAAQNISQWGVDLTTEHVCQDCGADIQIAVTANPVSFFT